MKIIKPFLVFLCIFFVIYPFATPQIQRFQRRSKHSEGKSHLGHIYQAQQAYYDEFGEFTTNLEKLYIPDGNLKYVIAMSPKCEGINSDTLRLLSHEKAKFFSINIRPEYVKKAKDYISSLPCPVGHPQKFTAYALGDLNAEDLDIWSIDQEKKLQHIQANFDSHTTPLSLDIFIAVLNLIVIGLLALGWTKITESNFKSSTKYTLKITYFCLALFFLSLGATSQQAFKPVIYLYPEKAQMIKVELLFEGQLDFTYPQYDQKIKGWEVWAAPSGLLKLKNGDNFNYLFWEGEFDDPLTVPEDEGYVFAGAETVPFLKEKLKKIGLLPHEYNDFIVYWAPLLKNNPFNYVYFAQEEYLKKARLKVTPNPDTVIRIFAIFKPLNKFKIVKPQIIVPRKRTGFVVVEWGGTILK